MTDTVKTLRAKAAAYNPRKITDAQLEMLGHAMAEFGDLGGIVVNARTGRVVGGHQRLKKLDPAWPVVVEKRAAKGKPLDATGTVARGYVDTPVGPWAYREVDWDETKEKAGNLAANQHGGEFDLPQVKDLLVELDAAGLDVSLTGFTVDDLADLLADDGADLPADVDSAPAAPKTPVTQPGDLWTLGAHRLLCGDATKASDWDRLMGGGIASCVFTDPPYGVSYKARSGQFEVIEGDDKRDDALFDGLLVPAFKQMAAHASATAAFYVWHASSTREDFAQALKAAGLVERQYLIWAKSGPVMGHSDYRWQHEPCFYASKDGAKAKFYGDRAQSTVWRAALRAQGALVYAVSQGLVLLDGKGGTLYLRASAPATKKTRKVRLAPDQAAFVETSGAAGTVWEVSKAGEGAYQHPTQKPVELAVRALENSSRPGEIVVDCFLGSGTTLLAAELRQRRCFGLEMDPTYADVVVRRWEQATGQKAMREAAQ